MINEKQVREQIAQVIRDYKHVLDCYPATVQINAPRAMMQLAAQEKLDTLYAVLGEKRPKFNADDYSKLNH